MWLTGHYNPITTTTTASKWAAVWAIVILHSLREQSRKTVSINHNGANGGIVAW